MRRLSFLISLIIGPVLLSCGNRNDRKERMEPIVENTNPNLDTVSDSARPKSSADPDDSLATKKNNTTISIKEAPKHGTPEQQKLDSIKAAKAKEKNN